MKATFRRNLNTLNFYVLLFIVILILAIDALMSPNFPFWPFLLFLLVPLFLNYRINDKNNLYADALFIPISNIQKVVYQNDGIDIYFTRKNGKKVHYHRCYVKDREGFVRGLQAVNPAIKVI